MFNNKQKHLSKEEILQRDAYLAEQKKQQDLVNKMIMMCKEAGYDLLLQISLRPIQKAEEVPQEVKS